MPAHPFARILVPTDFSAASDAALEYARTLAQKFGSALHILHVLEDPYTTGAFATELYAPLPAETRDALAQDAQARLAERAAAANLEPDRVVTMLAPGLDTRAIVDYAADNGIDLIVMGTHGRRGVSHLLLGSVAERVVRTAPCPVLTVRGALPGSHLLEGPTDAVA